MVGGLNDGITLIKWLRILCDVYVANEFFFCQSFVRNGMLT